MNTLPKDVSGLLAAWNKGDQSARDELLPLVYDELRRLARSFANEKTHGPPSFRGPFVQGPRTDRFVYISSGTYAGQHASCWTVRESQ